MLINNQGESVILSNEKNLNILNTWWLQILNCLSVSACRLQFRQVVRWTFRMKKLIVL